MPNTSKRGFTLIELLVVMTILVILVLVALPVFSYITASRSTESGLNLVSAMLGRARALAVSRTDSKYIGVLFYRQVDDDRDAMQIIEVDADAPGSGLERYFSHQDGVAYRPLITTVIPPHPADVVYGQIIDSSLGGAGGRYNGRPVVKRYVKKALGGDSPLPANAPVFENASWGVRLLGNTVPVALDADVQYLPLSVRARVLKIVEPGDTDPTKAPKGVATIGMILFDKQGRVTQRRWGITKDEDLSVDGGEKLLNAMGITQELPISDERRSGVGITVFNDKDLVNDDLTLARPLTFDAKNQDDLNRWAAFRTDQYTVSMQTGELVGATR